METQTPLVLPPEHNNRKFTIIIASLFVLFTVSASLMYFVKDQLGYYPEVIQNQKNTSNEWKTYRNDEYGFEFKYPGDWVQQDGVLILKSDLVSASNSDKSDYKNSIFYFIDNTDIHQIYPGQSISEYVRNTDVEGTIKSQKDVLVGGINSTQVMGGFDSTVLTTYIPIKKGILSFYIFTNSVSGSDTESLQKVYNQILSTFKFINSTTTDISNWKTYRNEEYGFELKMPSDWVIKKYNDLATFRIQSTDIKNNLHGTGIPVTGNMWIDIFPSTCKDNNSQQISKFIPESVPDTLTSYNCRGGIGIDMGLWQNDNDLKNHEDILIKIFSSFKFLNSTTTDISDWKTYRNEEYGFEFKYPDSYAIDADLSNKKGVRVSLSKQSNKYLSFYIDSGPLSEISSYMLSGSKYKSDITNFELMSSTSTDPSIDPTASVYWMNYLSKHNINYYSVSIQSMNKSINDKDFKDYSFESKQILSTFKFNK